MPTRDELLDLFRKSGALLEGHFRLFDVRPAQPRHTRSARWCSSSRRTPRCSATPSRLTRTKAAAASTVRPRRRRLADRRHRPRGRPRARRPRDFRRTSGRQLLHAACAGFTISESDRVLVVEDVLTTGGSTRETMLVASGVPVGGSSARRRSSIGAAAGRAEALDVPFHALLGIFADLPTYQPESCPLCAAGAAGGEARVAAGAHLMRPLTTTCAPGW